MSTRSARIVRIHGHCAGRHFGFGFVLVLMLDMLALPGCGKQSSSLPPPATPGRHHEPSGGFSYDPPPNWEITESPGCKYRISRQNPSIGFAPNINITEETFAGSLDQYVGNCVYTLGRTLQGFGLESKGPFQTQYGLDGQRLVCTHFMQGSLLRQWFYIFEKGDRKFVITCTCLNEEQFGREKAFEASMKTFRFDP